MAKRNKANTAGKRGRPTDFTAELGDRLCAAISGGQSLRKVCAAKGMPDRRSVHRWLREQGDFCLHYARACEERGHCVAEEALAIADAPVPLVDGKMDPAAVQHARLQVDIRKWFASKLHPKVYGDKVAQEISGPDGAPVSMAVTLAPADWAKVLEQAQAKRAAHKPV